MQEDINGRIVCGVSDEAIFLLGKHRVRSGGIVYFLLTRILVPFGTGRTFGTDIAYLQISLFGTIVTIPWIRRLNRQDRNRIRLESFSHVVPGGWKYGQGTFKETVTVVDITLLFHNTNHFVRGGPSIRFVNSSTLPVNKALCPDDVYVHLPHSLSPASASVSLFGNAAAYVMLSVNIRPLP